jgi:hypothetical protein
VPAGGGHLDGDLAEHRKVLVLDGKGERQPARRLSEAEQDVGERMATLHA